MGNYIVEPEEAGPYYKELFNLVASKSLKLEIYKEYPFSAAGAIQAQKDLTGGQTVGKLLLKV
jgi:NADPH2:quinone reductase